MITLEGLKLALGRIKKNETVKCEHKTKFLRFFLDEKLTSAGHILYINDKISKVLDIIR